MKRQLLALAATLIIGLSGCKKYENIPTEPLNTAPTLPDFDQSLTPEQHLEAAIEALEGIPFTAVYGSGWQDEMTLTAGNEDALRQLIPNAHFIRDFCAMGMMVIPSNDGSFRYEISTLSPDDACQLICGRSLTQQERSTLSGYTATEGSIELLLDKDRVLKSLRLDLALDDALWTLQIQISR